MVAVLKELRFRWVSSPLEVEKNEGNLKQRRTCEKLICCLSHLGQLNIFSRYEVNVCLNYVQTSNINQCFISENRNGYQSKVVCYKLCAIIWFRMFVPKDIL